MKTVSVFGMLLSLALISPACGGETIAWYQQPAKAWHEALPVGNGRIGAMVFGGVEKELLQLNEQTVWSGSRAVEDQELLKAHGRLADIRHKGPNPYLNGFPRPEPFNQKFKINLVRNKEGLLIKAESEYDLTI